MRPILRAYADTGRTVVVSSHLLGEVELTCSHVVVMHAGRVLAAGSVEDLVGAPGADGSTSTSGAHWRMSSSASSPVLARLTPTTSGRCAR